MDETHKYNFKWKKLPQKYIIYAIYIKFRNRENNSSSHNTFAKENQ